MSIEEEIKQGKKFINEYEKLLVNLLFTSSWLESNHIKRFKPYGISPQQYNVLRILRGTDPKAMMLCDIASRMIDKNSNASRLVDKLVFKGLASRRDSEQNRRQVDISITEKGKLLLQEIDNQSDEWLNTMRSLSEKEAKTVNMLLDKLRGS